MRELIKMKNNVYQVSKIVQSDDQQVIQVDQKLSWISLTGIGLFVMDENAKDYVTQSEKCGKRFKVMVKNHLFVDFLVKFLALEQQEHKLMMHTSE